MKKIFVLLFFAAIAALVVFFLARPPGAKAPRASDLVSANTDVLLVLPDLSGTRERFTTSALGRMLADGAVVRFLQRPLERLAEGEGYSGARRELRALQMENLVVAMEFQNAPQVNLLVAFRAKGGSEKTAAALRRLLEEIVRTAESDGVILEQEEGAFRVHSLEVDGQILQTAVGEGWGVFSNSPAQLQGFLDRLQGVDSAPPLASVAEYAEVRKAMPDKGDLKFFARPDRLVDWMVGFAAGQGETLQRGQLATLAQLRSFGLVAGLDGGDTVEHMVFFGGPPLSGGDLRHPALPFAPASALFYGGNRLHLNPETVQQIMDSLPPEMRDFLGSLQVPPAQWADILGAEAGLFAAWPAASLLPAVVLVAEVKDREKLETLAAEVGGNMAGEVLVSRSDELMTMTWTTGGLNLVAPTLGLSQDRLFFSLTPGDLTRALETEKAGDGLATAPLWKDSATFFRGANQQVAVLDLPGFVQRLYTSIQPMLGFAAAMSPDLQRTMDLQLLPAPEDLNQYLGPVRTKQSTQGEAVLSEVRGPVTWMSVLLGLAAGLSDGFSILPTPEGIAGE